MVTKERLKELIKQDDKKIYWLSKGNSSSAVSVIKEYNNLREFASLILESIDNIEESVFETKEDAEFALKFKRIPRTEYFDLPTWEEFNSEDKLAAFTVYPHNYHLLKVGNYIYLRSFYGQGGMDIFNKPLTKENYLEVCELCRKLWLGEEI